MKQTTLNNSSISVLQSELLQKHEEVEHFFTLRNINDESSLTASAYEGLNLCNYTGDTLEHVLDSRTRVASAIGIDTSRLWFPRQVHGTAIVSVDLMTPPGQEADAVITQTTGLCIGVSTADCVPILLYIPASSHNKPCVAAIHAGWRGTVAHIVSKVIKHLCEQYGVMPENIIAVIGPSISPEAFEVGEEVADVFSHEGFDSCVRREYPKPHIDLWQANVMELLGMGVLLDNIDCTPICTYSNPELLFSARVLGVNSGRMVSCICLL